MNTKEHFSAVRSLRALGTEKFIFPILKKKLEDLIRERFFVQLHKCTHSALMYTGLGIFRVFCHPGMPITNHLQKLLFQFMCFCEWAHLLNCGKTLGPFKTLRKMSIMDANVRDMDKSNSSACEGFELGDCHSERKHRTCHF